jgi:hypothetical protein
MGNGGAPGANARSARFVGLPFIAVVRLTFYDTLTRLVVHAATALQPVQAMV